VSNKRIQFTWITRRSVLVVGFIVGSLMVAGYVNSDRQAVSNVAVTPEDEQQTVSNSAASKTPTTRVTVNGKEVPQTASGQTYHRSTTQDGDSMSVEVSEGQPVRSSEKSRTSANQENVQVSIDSSSNGGTSVGSTQVFGTSFSNSFNGSSSSFSSTHVFSAGSVNTSVSP
jgi:hypothetical protein